MPLTFTIDGVTYEDDFSDDAHYKEFYDKVRAGAMPSTSQINPFTHEEFWERVAEKTGTTDIVHLTLSSGLSETYSSACRAAQSFMEKHPGVRVYVVDSLGATQAEMPVFEMALRLRDNGESAAAVDGQNELVLTEVKDREAMTAYLMQTLRPEDVVLLKASNGMKLFEVAKALTEQNVK